tara:strand:+ start:5933 stop:6577 length:645 start_codon:yes stop_codon:yes gene_type:complete
MKSKFEFEKVSPGWHYDKWQETVELFKVNQIKLSKETESKVSRIIKSPYEEGGIKRVHIGDATKKIDNEVISARITHMTEAGYKPSDYFIEFINDKFLELEKNISNIYSITNYHACAVIVEPAQCMPVHDDTYSFLQKYMKKNHPEIQYQLHNIKRYLTFLTDWEWGQCLGAGNTIAHQWRKGDTYQWKHKMLHWCSNASMKPMVFFEITGLEL